MILNIDEQEHVVGEIYKMTNTANGKAYIGQTRSHRLNHNKYRPFGYNSRFKDHIHEAYSSKKNHSRYLNYAIRKYGEECFTCERIHTCPVDELDTQEKHYIIEFETKYPNGYNLTDGGRGFTDVNGDYIWRTNKPPPRPSTPSQLRSDYTKKLISDRLKSFYSDNKESCENRAKITQKQHLAKKYDLFKDVIIDDEKIDSYIQVVKNNTNNSEFIRVVIDKTKTTFVSKYEPIAVLKDRARQFIFDLKERPRSQIAGNPLEPQTTTP